MINEKNWQSQSYFSKFLFAACERGFGVRLWNSKRVRFEPVDAKSKVQLSPFMPSISIFLINLLLIFHLLNFCASLLHQLLGRKGLHSLNIYEICVMCAREAESASHLFIHFEVASISGITFSTSVGLFGVLLDTFRSWQSLCKVGPSSLEDCSFCNSLAGMEGVEQQDL